MSGESGVSTKVSPLLRRLISASLRVLSEIDNTWITVNGFNANIRIIGIYSASRDVI